MPAHFSGRLAMAETADGEVIKRRVDATRILPHGAILPSIAPAPGVAWHWSPACA
jgi:hypothetical protein